MKHIHFVGIKGVGVAPLALIAKEAGMKVTGSDIADTFITDSILQKHDIHPFVGFNPSHLEGSDVVITTGAHGGYDNEEVVAAKKNNIPVLTQGQAVGEFMKGEIFGTGSLIGISIAGTHGKTTTTAMIASLLHHAQLDPSWVIGTSEIPGLGESGHYGQGKYFVAEADEYANEPTYDKTPKMLLQHPKIAVITNVEHDHPDVYPTIEDSYKAFMQFANLLPHDGVLIACGDDEGVKHVLHQFDGKAITYGVGDQNTYRIQHIVKTNTHLEWDVVHDEDVHHLSLSIPGEHNMLNATAAYIVGIQCGVKQDTLIEGLQKFTGTTRRLEYIGQLSSGALLYDDYAHHPTEIKKTLTALRDKYPDSHIICIFQPHTYSRTKLLFDQFVDSLSLADEVILTDIYASKRESFDKSVSSAMLGEKIQGKKPVVLAKTLSDVIQYVTQKSYGEGTVVITCGAGDIYQIANSILG